MKGILEIVVTYVVVFGCKGVRVFSHPNTSSDIMHTLVITNRKDLSLVDEVQAL